MSTISQNRITFWLNGKQRYELIPPGMTTLEMLNHKLGLHGTKSSCNEGDCGACTVVIGQKTGKAVKYQAVNSCLYPAFRLHGRHLITVEGISVKDELHPIQVAMLDEHATQCGFCTPGFVMSLLGLHLNYSNPREAEIMAALEGNLCRCTGYASIFKAAKLLKRRLKAGAELLPLHLSKVEKLLKEDFTPPEIEITGNREGWETISYYAPTKLTELWKILKTCGQDGSYKYIAGGTDLMVLANIQHIHYKNLIDLGGLSELNEITPERDTVFVGANATFAQLQQSLLIKKHFPLLNKVISQMASAQIRNSATLAGNIANASPVADGATALLALEAFVLMASRKGERLVKLSEFYKAYKQTELKKDEIIKAVIIPMPQPGNRYHGFIKSAKRKAVDISSVVSAINIEYKDNKIIKATLSFGGVAAYPALAVKTMEYLKNKKLAELGSEKAETSAANEFTPITDIRGSEQYRKILIKNHVKKHLDDFYKSVFALQERAL